jgi:uncharacterized protein (DUF58 family)
MIVIWLVLCVLCAYYGKSVLGLFFAFMFILALCAYGWGRMSVRRLEYTLSLPQGGVFPGQSLRLTRTLTNHKLLPLAWLEILEPCDPEGCVVPDPQALVPNPKAVEETPPEDRFRCLSVFGALRWRQTIRYSDDWTARRRGIRAIGEIEVRSGDGFGLYVAHKRLALAASRRLVVYPALAEVSTAKIIQDMWEARAIAQGYLEDNGLIKSVRDYEPGDPANRINQRLLARGQGLKVNRYEVVAPDSVMFMLDSASFAGSEPEPLEATLSILASLFVGLSRQGIQAGLMTPLSRYFPQTCLFPGGDEPLLERILALLAAVGREDPPLTGPVPAFVPELAGQTYYIAFSRQQARALPLLAPFPPHKTRLLLWEEDAAGAEGAEPRTRTLKSFRMDVAP